MANIERIKTDEAKEIQGVWVDYILGIRLKVARARNPKYQEELRNLVDPKTKDAREDKLDIQVLANLLNTVRARTILLGWENIDDNDGKPIPFSVGQSEKFFADPELKDFCSFVVAISENADQYAKEVLEESAKN
ncbi:hypothetical protein LCGC14_0425730 [marine sediment metagenome]|uniref:Uncharacterized protein n=1 Tax=marine sediment metagenome TaxID=412755 RepID=A0A0F9VBP7_9ZZZZ